MIIFEREIKASAAESDGLFNVGVSLADTSHEMRLNMVVDPVTMVIKEVQAEIIRAPYAICSKALDEINLVVGLKIEPGINRKVKELIGGIKGCTHIIELFQEGFKTAYQGNLHLIAGKGAEQEKVKKLEEILKGTCLRYV